MKKDQLLDYADDLAHRLRTGLAWKDGEYGSGYWEADKKELFRLVATATEAREFLRLYAGPDSQWFTQAADLYVNHGEGQSRETGIRAIGDLLDAWSRQVRAGVIEIFGERALEEISSTRTDLMDQVRHLLEDKTVHSAAPIVLCGAALEIALRAIADAKNVAYPVRSGIDVLAAELRRARLITVQDVKEINVCAGVRNLAAHGEFDALDAKRAGLMEQMTITLLRRLAEIQAGPDTASFDSPQQSATRN
ncbi:hypothetical protein [Amycolatopsis sp. Poz14]|uniref:hypothetical protein n=1 Tax=Amycolatopsis sp. Poz14 TaxID=1447705 RepID=UPI001EE95FAB|nr:hypothetical protein [Amycolatopsis sp. Poz14]MCG3754772.1 hypothetical protein [Amycolatopsis sp. Poz14]